MAACTSVLKEQEEGRSNLCLQDTLDHTKCVVIIEVAVMESHANSLTLQKSALTGMVSVKGHYLHFHCGDFLLS